MKYLVAFTLTCNDENKNSIIIRIPHSGVIKQIHITAPYATDKVTFTLQICRGDRYEPKPQWHTMRGTEIEVDTGNPWARKPVSITVPEDCYYRIKLSDPNFGFRAVYQFILQT